MRSQRIRWSRLVVQKPVWLEEKCASDDNESNRASTTPSPPLCFLVMLQQRYWLTKNYILQQSCCRCYFVYFRLRCTLQSSKTLSCASLSLKRHVPDTIQALFTHLRLSYQMEEKRHNVKWSLSANVLWLWQRSFSPLLESSQNKQLLT